MIIALLAALRRYWPAIAVVAVLTGSHLWVHHAGVTSERTTWEARWAQRDAADETARANAEAAARVEEQKRADWAQGVQRDATQALEQVRVSADSADADNQRLRGELGKLQARLGGTGKAAATPASSTSATRAAMVLSELYGSCQGRLAELSPAFDRARIAGLACERAYDGRSEGAGK